MRAVKRIVGDADFPREVGEAALEVPGTVVCRAMFHDQLGRMPLCLVAFEIAVFAVAMPLDIADVATQPVFQHGVQSEAHLRTVVEVEEEARIERKGIPLGESID